LADDQSLVNRNDEEVVRVNAFVLSTLVILTLNNSTSTHRTKNVSLFSLFKIGFLPPMELPFSFCSNIPASAKLLINSSVLGALRFRCLQIAALVMPFTAIKALTNFSLELWFLRSIRDLRATLLVSESSGDMTFEFSISKIRINWLIPIQFCYIFANIILLLKKNSKSFGVD